MTGIERQGWSLTDGERATIEAIRGDIANGYGFGRVHPEQRHCDDSDGFERWNVCGVCGGIRIDCFCCGSVSRLSTCTCRHDRTH